LRDCNQKNNQKNAKPCTTPDLHFRSGSLGVPKIEEWANLTNVSVALKAGAGDDMVIECLYCLARR
jgi:hypothetical protein